MRDWLVPLAIGAMAVAYLAGWPEALFAPPELAHVYTWRGRLVDLFGEVLAVVLVPILLVGLALIAMRLRPVAFLQDLAINVDTTPLIARMAILGLYTAAVLVFGFILAPVIAFYAWSFLWYIAPLSPGVPRADFLQVCRYLLCHSVLNPLAPSLSWFGIHPVCFIGYDASLDKRLALLGKAISVLFNFLLVTGGLSMAYHLLVKPGFARRKAG